MFKRNLNMLVLSVVLLFLSFQKGYSNLLPGSVVQIGRDQYSYVENLNNGQLLVTQHEQSPREFHRNRIFENLKMEKHSDKAVLIELRPEEGDAGLLMVGCDQYFHRQNALAQLKPKLLRNVKKGKEKALRVLLNAVWVKAEDLKIGDKLVGKYGQTLFVTKVEPFEFEEKQDFHEISLKHHHMYYLLDTAGNHILTHNLDPFTIYALGISVGAILGGISGAVYAHKTSKRDGGPTGKEIAKKVILGGLLGAAIGVVISYFIHYPSKIKDTYSSAKALISKYKAFIIENKTGASILAVTAGGFSAAGYFSLRSDPNEYKATDLED